jgi:hypothetical protein
VRWLWLSTSRDSFRGDGRRPTRHLISSTNGDPGIDSAGQIPPPPRLGLVSCRPTGARRTAVHDQELRLAA